MRRALAPLLPVLGIVLWTQPASAYCRTMTCELERGDAELCPQDADGCVTEGRPTRWPSPCLSYAVQLDGSPAYGLDADQLAEVFEQAFELWRNVTCEGGGAPRFHAQFSQFVTCDHRETVCGGARNNVNVMMMRDDWPYLDNQIGLTTPAGSTDRGELYDADIELNSEAILAGGGHDLFTVVAHELGHFLGLSHSRAPGALMNANYRLASASMPLSDDDIAGICAIFPPASSTLECAPPSAKYDICRFDEAEANEDQVCRIGGTDAGCSIAGGSRRPSTARASTKAPAWAWIGALIGALCWRRWRSVRSTADGQS